MKYKTAWIFSLIAIPLVAAVSVLHAQTSDDKEAELARWEAFIADQQKTLDATEFDLQFTITDTDGKPLDGVSVEIEQDRPVLQQLLSGKSETKREKKMVDSRFRIQAKGWPSLELTFMKDGYYIETRRYHINFMPNDSRDLGPDGKPKLVMKEDIQVVMYKGIPAAELIGTWGSMQYDFEKGTRIVCDLSALDKIPEKPAVSEEDENEYDEEYDEDEEEYEEEYEEEIQIEMKSVGLKTKPRFTKYIELDFNRDEKGEILFDGKLGERPCPASLVIRLHSDDPGDGLILVDKLESGYIRMGEYDKRYQTAPETGYAKEIEFDLGKKGADGKYPNSVEANYRFAFVKCGKHYGKIFFYPVSIDFGRNRTLNRVTVRVEPLVFNLVKGDRNVSDGGYYKYIAPRQPTEAEIKAAFEQKSERAKAQIEYLADALESYKLDVGTYPSELQGLVKNVDKSDRWDGPYIRSEVPMDPWGKDYQYSVDAERKTYRLVSSQEKLDDAPDRTADITTERFKLGKNAYLEMIRVEPGKFQMGEGDRKHEVTISAPYWIGRYEVTRAQWQAIMGNQRDYAGDNRPVGYVSWDDVQEFCRLLNEMVKAPDGYEFALPTEAQWEYAARGGAKSKGYQYSGGDKPDDVAWYNETARYGVSVVGKKAPNELGLYDMSGNIMEWCADAYQEDITKHVDGDTPVETGEKRVARGGFWDGKPDYCTVSARQGESPEKQYTSFGFRLAIVPVREKKTNASEKSNTAQTASAENMPETLSFDLKAGVPLKMVRVSAAGARFRMGEGVNSKAQQHMVNFKKDYYIGQYEVTQAQWNTLMEKNPSGFKGDDLPVEKVLWDEVMEFCRKLNETGKAPAGWVFTLPTESQWEFAAKGGTKTKGYKYSGSNELEDVAWYNDNSGDVSLKGRQRERDYSILRQKNNNRTHPVGTKKPNELGLYDMNGNVKEICLDSMDFNNSGYSDGDVAVPESRKTMKNTCVIRDVGFLGGADVGFNTERSYTYRNSGDFNRSSVFGFRLALVQAPEETEVADDDSDDGDPNVMKVELPGGIPLKLVKVEAAGAEFSMKTRSGTSDYESEHPVRFRNDFYIGKYEITQEQWKAVMGTNPAHNQGDRYPVERVPWDDVLEFCARLNAAGKAPDGWKFTLPTEAQWQYAARGGAKSKGYKYSGGDDPEEVAWCYDNFNDTKRSGENWDDEDLDRYNLSTHPVGQKKPNELGLYDMSGNVFELVLDSWRSRISDHIDGDTPETGGMNVAKLGGCFAAGSLLATPSYKTSAGPYNGYFMDGFRIALVKKPVFASSPADSPIGTAPGADPAGQADDSGSLTVAVESLMDDGDVSFEFVKVPAAGRTITMKLRPESESDKKSHTFYFHSDYYIGKYEVTQAQWQAFSRNSSKDKGDDLPVDNVSWDDATAFCKLLNETGAAPEGWEFALPTEAQWEYAARGGAKSKGYVFSGGNDPDEVAWFLDNSGGKTHPVGQKKPNELGIYDMTGNVWEWCADMCNGDYIRNTNGDMAPQKRSNAELVYRGGGRGYEPWFCVVSNRYAFPTYYRLDRFGLRLALVRKRAELQKLAAEAADQVKGNDGEDDDDSDEEDEEDEEDE